MAMIRAALIQLGLKPCSAAAKQLLHQALVAEMDVAVDWAVTSLELSLPRRCGSFVLEC
jgi:hypothetical protein